MENKRQDSQKMWSVAMRTMATATAWIVGPVLVGLVIGRALDQHFSSGPWLMIITLGLCFVLSMIGIARNALQEFKRIEKENPPPKK